MAKYLTVSENGQIEINWHELELMEDDVQLLEGVLQKLYTSGHIVTAVEDRPMEVVFHLKDEVIFKGEMIYGAYIILTFSKIDSHVKFDTFGMSDMKNFGYRKEGK